MDSTIQILSAKHTLGFLTATNIKEPTQRDLDDHSLVSSDPQGTPSVAQISNLRLAFGFMDSGPQAQSSREIVLLHMY